MLYSTCVQLTTKMIIMFVSTQCGGTYRVDMAHLCLDSCLHVYDSWKNKTTNNSPELWQVLYSRGNKNIYKPSSLLEFNVSKYSGLNNIEIKHSFSCINIHQVPWEVLKTEAEGRGFQHLPRDLANVNILKKHVWSLLLHKKWKHLLHFALFIALFCFAFSPMSREHNFLGLCSF